MENQSLPSRQLKPEQAAAAHTLDRHVSVTAGPGAGKTFVLVERYLEILRTRKVSVDNIVAITFTNRAANEMRQRVRERIDGLLRTSSAGERQTWLRHKRTLEGAVITTIHGFCSRLLREFPVEADIDPQFVLLDEHQAAMLLESVVEETVADAIHHGGEAIVRFAEGTGRAALATALIELFLKYRGEGLALRNIEKLTTANHASRADYDAALKQLEATMAEFFSVRLSKAAADKRAKAMDAWPALRSLLGQPPNEKTIAAYTQGIEDLWAARPPKNAHPIVERIDALLFGENPGGNDCLRGSVPAIGFDLLAKEYSLAVLKLLREVERRLDSEKQRLAVLDFDDLQLRALRLLERPEVLTRVSERYKFFLVDEFQDTNGVQRDLMSKLGLVRGANLFIVGDRKQSIYGFRGADVDIFTEMTAAIERADGKSQPLPLNFRSQRPLIDVFNFIFARVFRPRTEVDKASLGELGYVGHEPSVPLREAESDPPHVELLVGILNDQQADSSTRINLLAHERDAEQIAARIQELVGYAGVPPAEAKESTRDACVPKYKDIAILLRAFTGLWTYESALRRAGIPYLTVQGKGFYQREEITDLVQLLRFLDNKTDELSLAAVLRSPLCGISDNALLALRCAPMKDEDEESTHLRRRNLLRALRLQREIRFLDTAERDALERARIWIDSLLARRNRYGIADLLRHAVQSSEFITVIAANFDGAQRIANVEKLFRLAEQFEKTGFLIRDFVHYVEEFEAIGGREGEGQMDETANVVRLMTIHQAKGLEFPVVIIPDLHRDAYQRNSSFILDRHKGLTVRVPDGRGQGVRGALFNELSKRNRWREEFESMRLLYVAATRAEDRLILSGAVPQKELENLPKTESEKWLAWIWQALDLDAHPQTGVMNFGDGVQVQLAISREPMVVDQPAGPEEPQVASPIDPTRPLKEIFPLLQPIHPELGQGMRRFNVTQLINFQRCARQYYFERMLRTPGREERNVWNDAEAPEPPANLNATLKGAVIHRFCETYRDGDELEVRLGASFDEVTSQRQSELAGREFDINRAEAVRALLPLAESYLKSDVYRRVSQVAPTSVGDVTDENHRLKSVPQSSAGLWSELRFRLRRPLGILTGTIDKLLITPAADSDGVDIEIIDFKTNRFAPATKRTSKRATRTVATAHATSSQARVVTSNGQASFDFEAETETAVVTEVEVELSPPIADQVHRTALDYQLQMQAYALALRELFGSDSVKVNSLRATLHFLDPNLEISLDAALLEPAVCAQAIDDAMKQIAILDGTLDSDQFPPEAATHCRICNYVDLCPAGKNFLRSLGSLPT
ncbi:MAG TPA: UvrD-helicase domain-containing protein [Pyrinomonadaceae bacterium]|nr:UvrD-helicase domain-containing protein [Pyrinomonadaceae bacterium]